MSPALAGPPCQAVTQVAGGLLAKPATPTGQSAVLSEAPAADGPPRSPRRPGASPLCVFEVSRRLGLPSQRLEGCSCRAGGGRGRCPTGPGTRAPRLHHRSPGPGAITEQQRHLPYTALPESRPAPEVTDPFWLASLINPACSSHCAPFSAVGLPGAAARRRSGWVRAPLCAGHPLGPGDTGPKVRPSVHRRDPTCHSRRGREPKH